MSAIVLVKGNDRIFVVTDSAAYTSDGIVRGFVPKALPITHLRAVYAVRTTDAIVLGEMTGLLDVRTFSELKPEAMRKAAKIAQAGYAAEIYVAGFDENDVADAFVVSTNETLVSATPIDGFAITPMAPEAYADLAHLEEAPPDALDPVQDGRRIIETMRRYPIDGSIYGIGGTAQLLTVTRERITCEIICRWPDRIGERIYPGGDADAAHEFLRP